MFEINFCKNVNDWPKEKLIRGGEEYFPPYGYIGIALKILKKYSKYDKDNIWLGKEGDKEGEWAVAYHGIGKGNVFNKVLSILNDNLKQGPYQYYSDFKDVKNKGSNKNCLKGVYFAPDIKEAELYAKNINLGWSKKKFQFIIMSRVNPKSIRQPDRTPINWILNDNEDEIRPYRLLVKINESND